MGYRIVLGCDGVPDGGMTGNVCRCHHCEDDGTTGIFVVPNEWEKSLKEALENPFGGRLVVALVNEMSEIYAIPDCKRGARRFLTTTIEEI